MKKENCKWPVMIRNPRPPIYHYQTWCFFYLIPVDHSVIASSQQHRYVQISTQIEYINSGVHLDIYLNSTMQF